MQAAKLTLVAKMEELIAGAKHLRRALDQRWFEELCGIIRAWYPETLFELLTHTAFMGYSTDAICYDGTYLPLRRHSIEACEPRLPGGGRREEAFPF